MIVGSRFDTDEILEFKLFIVLLYLFDFATVFELGLIEVLPEKMF